MKRPVPPCVGIQLLTPPQSPERENPMCKTPITNPDGTKRACRKCGYCMAARHAGWVHRAMAERAMSPHTLAITLTYANDEETGKPPVGAMVFNYTDVQKWLKRLRKAYHKKFKKHGGFRYIICGEKGSLKGRCHWHCILFTDCDLSELGEWRDALGQKKMRISDAKRKVRLDWSLWGHGFVEVEVPGETGIAYVLKYILKEQFNAVNARGTMRETRADTYGASFFRMSKAPPIGDTYIDAKLAEWAEQQVVPVSLDLKIPGSKHYWHPLGRQRENLCIGLHKINEQRKEDTGRDCAGWSTLLATVPHDENDLNQYRMLLLNGEEYEEEVEIAGEQSVTIRRKPTDEIDRAHQVFRELEARSRDAYAFERSVRERQETSARRSIHKHCLGKYPCQRCLKKASAEAEEIAGARYEQRRADWKASGTTEQFAEWYGRQGYINPFCQNADRLSGYAKRHRAAAGVTNRVQKAARNNSCGQRSP